MNSDLRVDPGMLAAPVAPSPRTGKPDVDGLLGGGRWVGGEVTYAFPVDMASYRSGSIEARPEWKPGPVSEKQREIIRDIFVGDGSGKGQGVSQFTNLAMIEVASPWGASIKIAQSDYPPTAWAQWPYEPGSYVWFGTRDAGSFSDLRVPVKGNYSYLTHLHELGHSLGLMHAHDGDDGVQVPAQFDGIDFTVMTYRSYVGQADLGYRWANWSAPQSYMQLDIAALQELYGANYSHNAGDTTYQWDPNTAEMFVNGVGQGRPGGNTLLLTIWDGGGRDTYDMRNYGDGVRIDLLPGAASTTMEYQRAQLGDGKLAYGTVYNSRLHQGDERSMIENAIGGAGQDTIWGNRLDNMLSGFGGNDALAGGDGNDYLFGGPGDDLLDGGNGMDVAAVRGIRSEYVTGFDAQSRWTISDKVAGRDGNDTMPGVDGIHFANPKLARYFDTVASRHFYTANPEEIASIAANIPSYRFEGYAAYAVDEALTGATPVHRFYSAGNRDHHFTTSGAEAAWIKATLPQYVYEGVAFHVSASGQAAAPLGMARFVNKETHQHFFTADTPETVSLGQNPGWTYEGTAFYLATSSGVAEAWFA